MRVALQPAYILHSRPYRDTSLLLEVFTAEQGRISLVGKGARRRSRGGSNAALLQPFSPLLVSFSGRSELKNLTQVESAGSALVLRGERLFSGMYVNELLVKLLHRHDPHPALFAAYGTALADLAESAEVDPVLRRFELTLLDDLGYGFSLDAEGHTGELLEEEGWYHYDPELGLVTSNGTDPARPAYLGRDLLRMSAGEFDGDTRACAKRLMREALGVQLGDTALKSRELFRAQRNGLGGAS